MIRRDDVKSVKRQLDYKRCQNKSLRIKRNKENYLGSGFNIRILNLIVELGKFKYVTVLGFVQRH